MHGLSDEILFTATNVIFLVFASLSRILCRMLAVFVVVAVAIAVVVIWISK